MPVFIDIKVIPRSARSGLAGARDGVLVIRLNAPPVDGAANAELIEVLSAALRVPKRDISIVSGTKGRLKRVRVDGVTEEFVRGACQLSD